MLRGVIVQSLLLASLLACSHGILKWAAIKSKGGLLSILERHWLLVIAALLIYGFLFFYYLVLLQRFKLASIYSIYTGLAILLVVLSGTLFFHESLTRAQVIGCVCIVIGVLLVGMT
jgi:multidrug transporter EmrE-like cation transporter